VTQIFSTSPEPIVPFMLMYEVSLSPMRSNGSRGSMLILALGPIGGGLIERHPLLEERLCSLFVPCT
jgi:hypothetical protein